MALLDHLHANYSSEFSSSSESPDLIDFFMELEFLQSHEHICYLFKLSCLCLTSVSPQNPPVFMGKIDTRGLRSRVADMVLPCQSYWLAVPDSWLFAVRSLTLASSPSYLPLLDNLVLPRIMTLGLCGRVRALCSLQGSSGISPFCSLWVRGVH